MFDFWDEKLTLMTSGMAEDPFPRETNFIGENYKKNKQKIATETFNVPVYCLKDINEDKLIEENRNSTKC